MSICKFNMQVPALNIFETSFRRGKFDESRKLANGGMLEFAKIYPMDAVFDTPEDVPEEVCRLNHTSESPNCRRTWTIPAAASLCVCCVEPLAALLLGCAGSCCTSGGISMGK